MTGVGVDVVVGVGVVVGIVAVVVEVVDVDVVGGVAEGPLAIFVVCDRFLPIRSHCCRLSSISRFSARIL